MMMMMMMLKKKQKKILILKWVWKNCEKNLKCAFDFFDGRKIRGWRSEKVFHREHKTREENVIKHQEDCVIDKCDKKKEEEEKWMPWAWQRDFWNSKAVLFLLQIFNGLN